jgi:hypothetical protein
MSQQALDFKEMGGSQCLALHSLHADGRSVSHRTDAVILVSEFYSQQERVSTTREGPMLPPSCLICSNSGITCAVYERSVQS